MDRETILKTTAKIDDQFSLSVYKAAYQIDDRELSAMRNKMKKQEKEASEKEK